MTTDSRPDPMPSDATHLSHGTSWRDTEKWGFVPDDNGVYPPHRAECFGCGPDNESGLQIRIEAGEDDEIVCHYRFPGRFQGGPGVAHGGAIAAVLDDVVGTVSLAQGKPRVTGRLTVNFRRPVIIGHDVTVRAWADSVDGRKAVIKGEMRDSLGRVLAVVEALMIEMSEDGYAAFAKDLPTEDIPDDFKPFLPDENYP